MTIPRLTAARRAAGPLLLAILSGCDAGGPQAIPEAAVRAEVPSLLAIPADCRPLHVQHGGGEIIQAGYPAGPRVLWTSETDPRYGAPRREAMSIAARPPWESRSVSEAKPVAPAVLSAPAVTLPASVPAGPQLTPPDNDPDHPPRRLAVAVDSAEPAALPPLAATLDVRHEDIEAAAAIANAHLQRGFHLAERRASYSAKAEFFKALWLMAQALDGPANDRHVAALTAATRALDEAEDFAPQAGRLDAPVEVKLVVGGHRTPALKSMPLERITPRMALDRYLVFAQQKLAEAVDGQAVGSKALYLLGRLHTVVAQDRTPCFAAAEQKALAFQQAAMSADPNNFLAANELGVLLARAGRHEEARTILQHCAALAPRPEVWHNLVVVHRNLGEIALAQEAQQHLIAAQTRQPAAIRKPRPAEMVRWVEPAEFAQAGPVPAAAAIPPRASETPVAPAAVESSAKPSAGPLGWFAWPGRQSR